MKPYLHLPWGLEDPIIEQWKIPVPPNPRECHMWNFPLQFFIKPKINLLLKNTFLKVSNLYPTVKSKLENNYHLINFDVFSIFYTPSNSIRNIHIDGIPNQEKNDWAINFLLDQTLDEKMNWYRVLNSVEKSVEITVAGTPYLNYKPNEVELTDSCSIKGYTLVNNRIPHSVINNGPGHRYAISLRCRLLSELFSFKEMYNFFQDTGEICYDV